MWKKNTITHGILLRSDFRSRKLVGFSLSFFRFRNIYFLSFSIERVRKGVENFAKLHFYSQKSEGINDFLLYVDK